MSKERELLERVMSLIDYRYAPSEAILVHREIQELLAQPEREPLSDGEITKNTPKLIHIGERLAFHAGVKFAEKCHGIGGEE